ncbi:MAG: hypothetical protein LBV41_09510 [Cytophagaceae bacterium]|jgi:hypothetical protein|nr:hypothetical protein [Cytophagaceae bacterium]
MKSIFLFFACTVLSATSLTAQLFQNDIQLPIGKSIYIGAPTATERLRIASDGSSSSLSYGTYLCFISTLNTSKSIIFHSATDQTSILMGDNYDGSKRLTLSYIETASGGDAYIFNKGGRIYIAPKRTDSTNGVSNNGKPVAIFDAAGLTVRGSITVSATAWSDFVFSKDYKLPALNEVKVHIEEHKTLPGIPSEAEVKDAGIDVGTMQAKLLQKIEELTLYVIELKEENENQSLVIEELKGEINNLKK